MKFHAEKALGLANRVLSLFPGNARRVIETILLSVMAGLAAVLFLKSTNVMFGYTYLVLAGQSMLLFALGSFLLITVSSLVVCLLLKNSPEAAGSGVPQLKVAYWKELGYLPWVSTLKKFVAGVISLGGGMSLGREGPTLYMTAGLTSLLSGYFGRPKRARRDALTVGAAAGLAAAFNTPLAAITFVLEELVGDLSNRYLGAVVLASVIGALVVQACLGPQPAFALPEVDATTWKLYLAVPVVALLATACGIFFDKATLYIRQRLLVQRRVSRWILPLFGGLLTWCIAVSIFLGTGKIGIFGIGYGDLTAALGHGVPWRLAGVLTLAKIAATVLGYAFGGCGGIFSPCLFIGGMCGFFVAGASTAWLPLTPSDHVILAGVGMCACLCAVLRAPLTSLLIVFEMTHEFSMVPPLMIGVIICEAVTRLFGSHNFYMSLLLQDGHELVKISPPRDLESWQAIKAGQLMGSRVVSLESLDVGEARKVLDTCPYRCFPVRNDGTLHGVVTRDALRKFVDSGLPPHIEQAVTCHPDQTIRELADKFIQSPSGVLVVVAEQDGKILGILTLHDLLRAQAAGLESQT